MSDKYTKSNCIKPLSAAIGAAFVTSLAFAPSAIAADDPFGMQDLNSGYMVAGGEKHGGDKGKEGKCGEGKCGGDKEGGDKGKEGKCGEGKCGGDKEGGDKGKEGKCGEGKCGGDKEGGDKGEEGKCGGSA